MILDPDGHAVMEAVDPAHYRTGSVEVIDFIREQLGDEGFIAYCQGNAIKYLARAGKKGGQPVAQDLRKSCWYSQMASHVLLPQFVRDPREIPVAPPTSPPTAG